MPNPGLDPLVIARIQGMLLNGIKPKDIKEELQVSYTSISRAKAKISEDLLENMNKEQAEVISDLVMTQLEAGLEASVVIAGQAMNEEWRNGQNAKDLATFYGVVTDKSIRLLEASEAANNAARHSIEDFSGPTN